MAPAEEATLTPVADSTDPQPAELTSTSEQDPPDKDWKAEYARLRKDYDAKASRLKDIEKTVKSDEPTKVVVEDETDFKIENAGRIKLVKDEYKAELSDLQSSGAKLTPALMEKALRLAEQKKGINAASSESLRQASNASATLIVNRESVDTDITLTEEDHRFGVKAETKSQWKHLVEGQG